MHMDRRKVVFDPGEPQGPPVAVTPRAGTKRRRFRQWRFVAGGFAGLTMLVAAIGDYTGAPVGQSISRWLGGGRPPAEEQRRELRSFLRDRLRDGSLSAEDRRAAIDFSAGREIEPGAADAYLDEVLPDLAVAAQVISEGVAAADRQDFRAARDRFERATQLDPESAVAWGNLGGATLELGALAASEAALRRALALEPASIVAHYNLGTCLASQGQRGEALDHLERALVLIESPGQASGLDRRALVEDLRRNPRFASVRASTRFAALIERAASS